jgi:hypothetical protein
MCFPLRIEQVALGTKVSRRYSTTRPKQSAMHINVYASKKEKPMYVDEDCCVLIGKTKIEIPIRTRSSSLYGRNLKCNHGNTIACFHSSNKFIYCFAFGSMQILSSSHTFVWYVLLRITDSDYPFDIFKLVFQLSFDIFCHYSESLKCTVFLLS